jgi:broad specificity phosphatase PhoE
LCDVLPEMNKSENLLVVSHQAVIRCVVAYLTQCPLEELPYIKIPLHTIIKVDML